MIQQLSPRMILLLRVKELNQKVDRLRREANEQGSLYIHRKMQETESVLNKNKELLEILEKEMFG